MSDKKKLAGEKYKPADPELAAAAVATKSFGDNLVLAGNPATVIRTIEAKTQRRQPLNTMEHS